MNARFLFGLLAIVFVFASCQKPEDLVVAQEADVDLAANAVEVNPLESVLSIDYDKDNNNYYVVGVNNLGEIDVYYGQHKSWDKLPENRDIDNRYSPSEFVDFAIGAENGEAMFGVAVGNKMVDVDPRNGSANQDFQYRATSINVREFSNKAYFGDGAPKVIADDLMKVLSIDYDSDNNIYVVVGKNTSGKIDVYYGQHNNWKKLAENRDIDNRYSPSEFVDFAIGAEKGEAMYGVAVGNKVIDVDPRNGAANKDYQPRATSINVREFSNKPYFGDGKPKVIADDLEEVLSIDYDSENNIYVLVGRNTSGQIDVYTGQHNNWNKLPENRDIDNRYSPEEFVDFAIGAEDGEAMFGVAIGVKTLDVDPRNGAANQDFQPRGTSINARSFSGRPYFGDGKPEIIEKN